MDDALTDRISFVRFAGFSFDYEKPYSSGIRPFRNHLLDRGLDVKLFNMITEQLEAPKLIVKQGVVVDATIVTSARRPQKVQTVEEIEGQEGEEPEYEVNTTYSGDVDAKWTKKAGKLYIRPQSPPGQGCGAWLYKRRPPKTGQPGHMATDAEHGSIIGGHVTPANQAGIK